MAHRQHETSDFSLGLVTAYDSSKIKDGAASDVLSWECLEDRIRLTGGYQQIGSDSVTGSVKNIFTATKTDGTKVIWKKVGVKLYAKDGSAAWAEVGTNLFTGASDDIPSFDLWESFNGSWVWLSSPHSSLWKIPVANPTSVVEYPSSGYQGQIKIMKSRLWVWSWPTTGGSLDQTGITGSFLPPADIGNAHYTAVTGENIGTGTGAQTTFTETLNFKAGGATRNCFSVSATDGTETFSDTGAGTLTGSAGGTGTINYATGAISVTFAVAPNNAQAITSNYTWEDESSSGLADFSPLSAAAGDSDAHYLSQPSGGATKTAYEFNDAAYFVHERAVWRVTFDQYGDPNSNLVWRAGSGTSHVLGSVPTSDGIYFVDNSDMDKPNVRVITLDSKNLANVVCPSLTDEKLDLTNWTLGAMGRHNDTILVAAEDPDGNDVTLALSRRLGTWTKHPYPATCYASYGDTAIHGDKTSGLVYTMFDGTDADGFTPNNNWTSGDSILGYIGLKRVRELWFDGRIAPTQTVRVEVSTDEGDYVELGTIDGDGAYVRTSESGAIGDEEIGGEEIGNSTSGSPFPFRRAIAYTPDRFSTSKVRLTALGVGAVEIASIIHHGVRFHGKRLPTVYR